MSIQCKRCYWISCKEGHQDEICKDCLNELKILALERQLEEVREALSSIRGILPTVHSSDREIHEIINKVLKEQGDE